MSETKTGWRNWGDHPIVVLVGIVAAVISIVTFFAVKGERSSPSTERANLAAMGNAGTAQTSQSTPQPTASETPAISTAHGGSSSDEEESSEPVAEETDLSGTWAGILSQQMPDGTWFNYAYGVNISQNGNSVEGRSVIKAQNYYVIFKIRGTLSDETLSYDDVQIIEHHTPPGILWCQKEVELDYKLSDDTLRGTWFQNGCGSGRIRLERQ